MSTNVSVSTHTHTHNKELRSATVSTLNITWKGAAETKHCSMLRGGRGFEVGDYFHLGGCVGGAAVVVGWK